MAFNGMKVIHSGLGNRLRYIMNPAKTESGLLCAGINTIPDMAYKDMLDTKRRFGKLDKRQGYHIIQSFAPGEIVPEDALRFGMEFIEKYLGNRYEGVAAVHTDRAHIHVHMIFTLCPTSTAGSITPRGANTLSASASCATSSAGRGDCR